MSYKLTDRRLVAVALLLALTGLICGERLVTGSIIFASTPNAVKSPQNPDEIPATTPGPMSIIAQTAAGCPAPSFGANATLPSQAPWAVVVADFNNDGKADIASANSGFNNLTVALGDGAGGFGPSQTFPSAFGGVSIVAGDFNADGKLDLAVADWFQHQVAVSLGAGDGSFGSPIRINVGSGPRQVATGDFNRDGKLDFATVNFFGNNISVILGDGSGGFSEASGSPVAVSGNPRSLRVANLNGDDNPDIAVASEFGSLWVLFGNGLGGFVPAAGTPIPIFQTPYYVDSGDFNGDGKTDLVTGNYNSSDVSILFGNGAGAFQLVATVSVGSRPGALLVIDLTADGKPEIVSVNLEAGTLTILVNDGTGTLSPLGSLPVGDTPRGVAGGDLNSDGKTDLAVANAGSYTISILLGRGGGAFGGPEILPVPFKPASAVAVGDYNDDGHPDLAAAHAGGVVILLGDSAAGFTQAGNFGLGIGLPSAVVTPDLNGDGNLDLVALSGGLRVMLGIGDGSFGPRTDSPVGSGALSLASGDFNNDGKLDFATANYGSNNLSILLGNGFGGFSAASSLPVTGQTPFVVAGDFNNDGKTDLIASRRFQGDLMPFVGDGAGNFVAGTLIPLVIAAPHAIAVSDFNGDGQADLAVTTRNPFNQIINNVAILLGNGSGGFSAPTSYPVAENPTSIVVSDFNGDGNPDLATANRDSNNLSVLLGEGSGLFGSPTNFSPGLHPVFVAAGDVNGDGRKDLLAAIDDGITVLANTCSAPPVIPPSLSISDVSLTEGDSGTTNVVFDVTLSAPSNKTISVGFNTFGMTATSGVDFQPAAGRVFFTPGSTTQTVTVPILADLMDEFDETVGLNLKEELNSTISRSQGVATILDNDPPPSISISDVSIQEGNSGATSATFTVALSSVSGKPISLQYSTMDGSATSSDYVPKSGIVAIPAGTNSSTIPIQVNGDIAVEPDETFVALLSNPTNVEIDDAEGQGTIVNDDASLQLNATQLSVAENNNRADLRVTRVGATFPELTAHYATSDTAALTNCNVINGIASSRCDYAISVGRLSFAAGETSKTISIPIVDDAYAEGNETFTISLSNVTGATLGAPASAAVTINDNESVNGPNPIDQTAFFVRQQYVDFLNREPDPPGFAAWQAVIDNCPAGDTTCDRIHVSSAFFRSQEFQERGYFVYRFYPVALGRKPDYDEFTLDIAKVSGFLSTAELEAAKVAFVTEFMNRPLFISTFNGLDNTQYVDTLLLRAGITHQARDFWIATLGNRTRTRAEVLREICESVEVYNKYFNQAFVVMQYFGYLRRQPDALYLDWISHLEATGDYRSMINGFMNSLEYRFRFGP